jgi:hypothetical protein
METGYHVGNGREESTGRRLDGQRTVENFWNRKALKDATNQMMMTLNTQTYLLQLLADIPCNIDALFINKFNSYNVSTI